MFEATCKPIITHNSPHFVTKNSKKFQGGKFHVAIMHAEAYDENEQDILGIGPQYSSAIVIQNVRGKTLGKSNLERGRLEDWGGDYHWAGFESDLPWMKVRKQHPTEMQIILYHKNRWEKQKPFGRALFSCLQFPDDNIYQCVLPIESIPDMMGKSSIVGTLCANVQFVGYEGTRNLQVGEMQAIDPDENDDITIRVGFDVKDSDNSNYSVSLLVHGEKGEFLFALDGKGNVKPDPKYESKASARLIEIGDGKRISDNKKRTEFAVVLSLSAIETKISSFFIVLTADQQLTNLQNCENLVCEVIINN